MGVVVGVWIDEAGRYDHAAGSMVSAAPSETRPISAILPFASARSASKRGAPVPSTIVPPLMMMS
jgi:hypothetical protein